MIVNKIRLKGINRLNIIFIADVSISNVIGGAERVLFEQATRMARRGHNVHILTRRLPGHRHDQEVVCGVTEWRYNVSRRGAAVSFLKSTWQNSRQLFKSLEYKIRFDGINFHQPFSAIGAVQSPLSRNIKKVYTCHSLSFEEYISRNAEPAGYIAKSLYFLNVYLRKWLENRILKKSDKIVVLSRFTRDKLLRVHRVAPQKVTLIPGGVDLRRFQPAGDKIEIRRRFNIPPQQLVLFTVRNLVPRMGLENLIVALKDVVKSAPDVCLVVGGEGALKGDLMALAARSGLERHVRFAGFIAEDRLPQYYQMADLFVLPTRELEGFGLVTLEALACGLPVLGTPVGGTREILGRFDADLLFENTGPDAMAALILEKCRMIDRNPEEWKNLSKRCRQFVEENYSWEKNVDSLEKIFYGGR